MNYRVFPTRGCCCYRAAAVLVVVAVMGGVSHEQYPIVSRQPRQIHSIVVVDCWRVYPGPRGELWLAKDNISSWLQENDDDCSKPSCFLAVYFYGNGFLGDTPPLLFHRLAQARQCCFASCVSVYVRDSSFGL